ncbi:sulfite exporter TauE/SafE family protein [Hymenobacter properus]|uniref:Sulfite exporter TauE/SafE family protein n=1 Tax=Hymenobacter properus TaxID=2791026 RepID=A0A931BLE8_9BACT|nr:sulfite exporter TauE/SafE family protein [Hymenobacter properus]MBF9141610.1 sulfite exporter TauE/SafE family protein [Hymenobacter properus]MBR7720419.1 sulfite exporter TauE/SafE family protein [Microvirga sp. SRT04]
MLLAGFLFGLLGSFHCVGMCGAIALALPGQRSGFGQLLTGRLLYNLGRVSTYAALGAGAGLVGESLRLAGVQQGLSIASGVLILLLVAVPERHTGRLAAALGLARPLTWVKTTLAGLFQHNSWPALYATGLLNGLLPCGLVYLALAGALSAPGVTGAAAYMACFGLGTLPLMLGLALSGQLVPLEWRGRLRRVVPYAASGLAVLFIVRGLGLGIPYLSPQLDAATEATTAAQPLTVHYCH